MKLNGKQKNKHHFFNHIGYEDLKHGKIAG